MDYDFRAVPEASWYALGTALAAIVGSILTAVGVDPVVSGPIIAALAGLPRVLIGILLPQPKVVDLSGKP